MTSPFEKMPSSESKEKITYLGQAVFGFDKNSKLIIEWLKDENLVLPILNEKDILLFKFPGQQEKIMEITIGNLKDISQPLEINILWKNFKLDLSNPENKKKKSIFDVYRVENSKA